MAVTPQIKANQLIKDLNIKSKEMSDIMSEKGLEFKAQKALEPIEFEAFFDAITSKHQIEGIDDYIDGVTFIPSKLEKAVKKPAPEKKAEAAEEKVVEKKENTEKKADAKAVAAPVAVEKTENKGEVAAKAEPEKKVEPKAQEKKENAPKASAPAPAPAVKVQPKVDRAEALASKALNELLTGQYTSQYQYVEKFDTMDHIYTINKGEELLAEMDVVYMEFSNWLGGYEM